LAFTAQKRKIKDFSFCPFLLIWKPRNPIKRKCQNQIGKTIRGNADGNVRRRKKKSNLIITVQREQLLIIDCSSLLYSICMCKLPFIITWSLSSFFFYFSTTKLQPETAN
jgi:hypothetical protein